ncbi:PEP-CTERM sorting domain-containing protein [Desulfomarina sp.]
MKKLLQIVTPFLFFFTGVFTAQADPVDLTTWSPLTLDYSGGQPAGSWVLQAGNTAVKQVVNADPSFYLNNLNQTSYSMDGSWQVDGGWDDDYMGFVFGYQNSSNFYLFDWKQGSQGYVGTTAAEGMTVKKMTGATGNGLTDLSLAEFWENENDFGDMEVLAQNHGANKGWVDEAVYTFHLDFNLIPGTFTINVRDASNNLLWDVTVLDSTFTSGQFGFYNYSQEDVLYAGFEQTGGTTVPEPATVFLFGIGLAGLAGLRFRNK